MRRSNFLLAAAGAMLVSFGAQAGEIYVFSSIRSVEHENTESSTSVTYNTTLTGVMVGQTQVVTLSVPTVAAVCWDQLYKMQEQPGTYTLRVDVEWNSSFTSQYMRSCKLQRI